MGGFLGGSVQELPKLPLYHSKRVGSREQKAPVTSGPSPGGPRKQKPRQQCGGVLCKWIVGCIPDARCRVKCERHRARDSRCHFEAVATIYSTAGCAVSLFVNDMAASERP